MNETVLWLAFQHLARGVDSSEVVAGAVPMSLGGLHEATHKDSDMLAGKVVENDQQAEAVNRQAIEAEHT